MAIKKDGIFIGNISGGTVNFGGIAVFAPISKSRTITGAGSNNVGFIVITNSR